jgi:hypothetical protein
MKPGVLRILQSTPVMLGLAGKACDGFPANKGHYSLKQYFSAI